MPNRKDQYRQTFARWTVALCEPLIGTAERQEVETQMSQVFYENTEWANTWFAGMIASTIRTLPSEDPWRRLSAAFYPDQGNPILSRQSEAVPVPSVTGARTKGKAFGTRRDHTDMIIPEFNDWLTDLQLAAVTKEIDDWSSALVGFGGHGWCRTREAMDAMNAQIVRQNKVVLDAAGRSMFEVASEALKYAIHRRRAYVGMDDAFVWSKGFIWITRSDQVISGREFSDDDLDADIADSRIADGEYMQFRLQ